jgi:TolA-binding protein
MPEPVEAPAPESLPESPHPLPSAGQPHAPWSERLADGDSAGILSEAQRRGVANVLTAASSEDLAALADAARFKMQDRLARRVLLTQRTRFPGTLRAKEASFLLGRLADGQGGRASDALAWYQRYLHEAPSGAYAAEAMGRMMIALERQQRTDEARAVATAYLRRFPQGVYARAAREVTSPR